MPKTGSLDREAWTRFLVIGTMCMAQSFPYAFLASAVPAVFRSKGLNLEDFWVFSLPLIPYWLKFVWAPWVDRVGSIRFGQRKSWVLPCTLLGAASVAAVGLIEPSTATLYPIALLLFVHAMIMSTQDIAVDAYTLENLRPQERGLGSGVKVFFEAAGEFAALAGLLLVYDRLGWSPALALAGALLVVFTLPMILRREPPPSAQILQARAEGRRPTLRRFAGRPDSRIIGGLLIGAGILNGALAPVLGAMLVDQGFTLAQVGLITGSVYSTAVLAGAAGAAFLVTIFGLRRALWLQGGFGLLAFLPIVWLVSSGATTVAAAIGGVFLAVMAIAQLHLIMTVSRMGWASRLQAATDFVIHGTLYNIGRTLAAAGVGFAAATLGWGGFALMVGVGMTALCAAYLALFPNLEKLVGAREERETQTGAASAAAPVGAGS